MKIDFLKSGLKFVERYKYVIIVIAAGIILLLLPSVSGGKKETNLQQPQEVFSLEKEEQRIAKALSEAAGIGKTEVVLTLDSSIETIYQTDVDSQSSESADSTENMLTTETVVISVGSGNQQAVVKKKIYPEYRGALVICENAESASVKLRVINAMRALTGLSSDKITVLSRKSK
jgi:stage III sporulation protein AG